MTFRIADLFCGAGGASKGLHDAGFEVVGFDNRPQPRYPYEFHKEDALGVDLTSFQAVWASPPCQKYCNLNRGTNGNAESKIDMIAAVRSRLTDSGLPFIIENGPNAPLIEPMLLCGSMFDPPMDIRRHRLFESNVLMVPPTWPCRHALYGPRFSYRHHGRTHKSSVVWVYGQNHMANETPVRNRAMGINWMNTMELTQSVPPIYAEFFGSQLIQVLRTK